MEAPWNSETLVTTQKTCTRKSVQIYFRVIKVTSMASRTVRRQIWPILTPTVQ